MPKSPSYQPCDCKAECSFLDESTPERPCWGPVNAVDEISGPDGEYWWVHACEGHFNFSDYPRGPYKQERKT